MLQRPKPATTNSENFRIKTIVLSLVCFSGPSRLVQDYPMSEACVKYLEEVGPLFLRSSGLSGILGR